MKTSIFNLCFCFSIFSCNNVDVEKQNISTQEKSSQRVIIPMKDKLNTIEKGTSQRENFTLYKNFDSFKSELYKGKLAMPNFENIEYANDSSFIEFIKKGCLDNEINFAGHYTIISKSCGAMCEHIFIVDRISGKIFTDLKLKNNNDGDGKWGYLFKAESKMIIANSGLFTSDSLTIYTSVYNIKPEVYIWDDAKFNQIQ